jgi:hypothetical protein
MPVILTTQEAEIRRIAVQSQPGQVVCKTLSQKKKMLYKKGMVEWLKIGPEFKPQYNQRKKDKAGITMSSSMTCPQ